MKLPIEVEQVLDLPTEEDAIKVQRQCMVADPQEHGPSVPACSGPLTLSGRNRGVSQT